MLVSWQASSQVLQANRIEYPILRDEPNYELIPVDAYGLFLYRRLTDQHLELVKLDTTLREIWRGYLPLEADYVMLGKRAEKENICFLFRYQDFTRFDFILFVINQANGNFIRYNIKNFIPFSPVEFQVTDSAAIMGGYYNRVPVVTHFSFRTSKSRILPGLLNEAGDLTQIKTYPDGNFDVLIAAKNFSGQKTIWIKNYDAGGELLRNQALEPEGNKNLIFARSMKTDNNMQIVAGVFGGRNSEMSRGFFMASVDPSGLQQLRYYNFADLENFFKYMRAKREKRIKDRIERRKIKGKKVRFSYRFLVHEIVPYNNQYILLGEAFYPRYRTLETGFGGGFFNPAYTNGSTIRNGRIFDGYYYTHAVVMGFDKNGEVIWDNSFEINDVRTFTLEQFVKLQIQDDHIVLLYLYDNQLRSKIIKGNKVLEGKNIAPINGERPAVADDDGIAANKLEHWYESCFFASGTQDVPLPQGGRAKVFYVNKITFQH
jgi:hypothetical protein